MKILETYFRGACEAQDELPTNYLAVAAGVLGGLVITAAIFLFLPTFLILALAVWFGVYFLISIQKVEYEYIFTSGDLDIDQITGNYKERESLS